MSQAQPLSDDTNKETSAKISLPWFLSHINRESSTQEFFPWFLSHGIEAKMAQARWLSDSSAQISQSKVLSQDPSAQDSSAKIPQPSSAKIPQPKGRSEETSVKTPHARFLRQNSSIKNPQSRAVRHVSLVTIRQSSSQPKLLNQGS